MTRGGSQLQHLIGLETEYAVRFRCRDAADSRPSDKELYDRLIKALAESLPVVDAKGYEPGSFLATGGAVKFECQRQSGRSGLVEGATPECRSPRDLLVWQRAQDHLLSQAAARAGGTDGEFVLIKNNRDRDGNTYGSHENYDTIFARGLELWIWRAAMILALPLVVLGWILVFVPLLVAIFGIALIGEAMYALVVATQSNALEKPARSDVIGAMSFDNDELPGWFEPAVQFWLVAMFSPVFLILGLALWFVGFRRVRRAMFPFLVSRSVWSGAGWLDGSGHYQISQKAGACNRRFAVGLAGAKPIISVGNLAESYLMCLISPGALKSLWRGRQRLHVTYGDASMCEEAEYLRLATTRLVLDAVEAGACTEIPRIPRLFQAIRQINDGGLHDVIARHRGKQLTAIEVQRLYLRQVRDHVEPFADEEVIEILRRWERMLERLEQGADLSVGSVDWVTKKFLIEEAGEGLSLDSCRMIDMKYHELSPEGYFFRLCETGVVEKLVSDQQLDCAMRTPPPSTRAAVRGRYIREFADTEIPIKVSWDSVTVGRGKEKKVVPLSTDR